jgi:hypothetical protein
MPIRKNKDGLKLRNAAQEQIDLEIKILLNKLQAAVNQRKSWITNRENQIDELNILRSHVVENSEAGTYQRLEDLQYVTAKINEFLVKYT